MDPRPPAAASTPARLKLGEPALDDDLEELFAARRDLIEGALGAVQAARQLLGAVVQEAVAQEDVLELLEQALEAWRSEAQGRDWLG